MAKGWLEVSSSPKFLGLSKELQEEVRSSYWEQYGAPKVSALEPEEQTTVRERFFSTPLPNAAPAEKPVQIPGRPAMYMPGEAVTPPTPSKSITGFDVSGGMMAAAQDPQETTIRAATPQESVQMREQGYENLKGAIRERTGTETGKLIKQTAVESVAEAVDKMLLGPVMRFSEKGWLALGKLAGGEGLQEATKGIKEGQTYSEVLAERVLGEPAKNPDAIGGVNDPWRQATKFGLQMFFGLPTAVGVQGAAGKFIYTPVRRANILQKTRNPTPEQFQNVVDLVDQVNEYTPEHMKVKIQAMTPQQKYQLGVNTYRGVATHVEGIEGGPMALPEGVGQPGMALAVRPVGPLGTPPRPLGATGLPTLEAEPPVPVTAQRMAPGEPPAPIMAPLSAPAVAPIASALPTLEPAAPAVAAPAPTVRPITPAIELRTPELAGRVKTEIAPMETKIETVKRPIDEEKFSTFIETYKKNLTDLVKNNPEKYSYKLSDVPSVVGKMEASFRRGSYNKDGEAIAKTRKELGLKDTYKGIDSFFVKPAGKQVAGEILATTKQGNSTYQWKIEKIEGGRYQPMVSYEQGKWESAYLGKFATEKEATERLAARLGASQHQGDAEVKILKPEIQTHIDKLQKDAEESMAKMEAQRKQENVEAERVYKFKQELETKTKELKGRKVSYDITLAKPLEGGSNKVQVQGTGFDTMAIRKMEDGKYQIDHIPTGMRVLDKIPSLAEARQKVYRLNTEIPKEVWQGSNPRDMTERAKQIGMSLQNTVMDIHSGNPSKDYGVLKEADHSVSQLPKPVLIKGRVVDKTIEQRGVMMARGAVLKGPEDIADMMYELRNSRREKSFVISMDKNNKILAVENISIGSLSAAIVHPRDTLKGALLLGADKFVFVHNHPSHVLTPSEDDKVITQKLQETGRILGIQMQWSIIVEGDKFHIIGEGDRDFKPSKRGVKVPMIESITEYVEGGTPIMDESDVAALVKGAIDENTKGIYAIPINTKAMAHGVYFMGSEAHADLLPNLAKLALSQDASRMVITTTQGVTVPLRDIAEDFGKMGVGVVDMIVIGKNGEIVQSRKKTASIRESLVREEQMSFEGMPKDDPLDQLRARIMKMGTRLGMKEGAFQAILRSVAGHDLIMQMGEDELLKVRRQVLSQARQHKEYEALKIRGLETVYQKIRTTARAKNLINESGGIINDLPLQKILKSQYGVNKLSKMDKQQIEDFAQVVYRFTPVQLGPLSYFMEPYNAMQRLDLKAIQQAVRELVAIGKQTGQLPGQALRRLPLERPEVNIPERLKGILNPSTAEDIQKAVENVQGNDLRIFDRWGMYAKIGKPLEGAREEMENLLEEPMLKYLDLAKKIGKSNEASGRMFDAANGDVGTTLTAVEQEAVDFWAERAKFWKEKLQIRSTIPNYIRHQLDNVFYQLQQSGYPLPQELEAILEASMPKQLMVPFLKERKGFPFFKRDFWTAVLSYERMAARKFAYDKVLPSVKAQIEAIPSQLERRTLRNFMDRAILGRPSEQEIRLTEGLSAVTNFLLGPKTIHVPPEMLEVAKKFGHSLPETAKVPRVVTPQDIFKWISGMKMVSYLGTIAGNISTGVINLTQMPTLAALTSRQNLVPLVGEIVRNWVGAMRVFFPKNWKRLAQLRIVQDMDHYLEVRRTVKPGKTDAMSEMLSIAFVNMTITERINRMASGRFGARELVNLAKSGQLNLSELDRLVSLDPEAAREVDLMDKMTADLHNYLYGPEYTPPMFLTPIGRLFWHLNSFSIKYLNRLASEMQQAGLAKDVRELNQFLKDEDKIKFINGLPLKRRRNLLYWVLLASGMGMALYGPGGIFELTTKGLAFEMQTTMVNILIGVSDLMKGRPETLIKALKSFVPFQGAMKTYRKIEEGGPGAVFTRGKVAKSQPPPGEPVFPSESGGVEPVLPELEASLP